MNTVLTPPRRRSEQLASVAVVLIGLAVSVGVACAVARLDVGAPTAFRRLTVQNPTSYLINVDVTGAKHDGWLDVGSFSRERQRTVEELADQGARRATSTARLPAFTATS